MNAAPVRPEPIRVPSADPARRRTRDRSHVRPVERGPRRWTRSAPAVVGLGIVMFALFALALAHALLIGGQRELDAVRRDIASEQEQIRRLRLDVAELEAPERILAEAESRLGMVSAPEVGYLSPDADTAGERIRVEAAVPPPAPVEVATTSPEAAAVEDGEGVVTGDDTTDAEGSDTTATADTGDADSGTGTGAGTDTESDEIADGEGIE